MVVDGKSPAAQVSWRGEFKFGQTNESASLFHCFNPEDAERHAAGVTDRAPQTDDIAHSVVSAVQSNFPDSGSQSLQAGAGSQRG